MRCRCSISRSRWRGASPSSAWTSSLALGSTALPLGMDRTLVFIAGLLSATARKGILDCGQVDFERELPTAWPYRREGFAAVLWHDVVRWRCRRSHVGADVPRLPRRRNQLLRLRRPVQQG